MAAEEINNPPSPLPYPEMILSAIGALNEANGSSETSISKYIESKYGDLPAGHTALLSHHLNQMKDAGEIVFSQNNYKKPDANAPAPPKRGRGRPPKSKGPLRPAANLIPSAEEINKPTSPPPYPEMILSAIGALNEANGSSETSISKYIESKYGDLPAGHTALLSHHLNQMKDAGEIVFSQNNYTKPDANFPAAPKRGRGRPPKPKDPLRPAANLGPSRPRGRPPKVSNTLPKPWKPKAATVGSGRPRGRPRKIARTAEAITGTATTTSAVPMTAGSGRPRGRPPKVKAAAMTEVSVQN